MQHEVYACRVRHAPLALIHGRHLDQSARFVLCRIRVIRGMQYTGTVQSSPGHTALACVEGSMLAEVSCLVTAWRKNRREVGVGGISPPYGPCLLRAIKFESIKKVRESPKMIALPAGPGAGRSAASRGRWRAARWCEYLSFFLIVLARPSLSCVRFPFAPSKHSTPQARLHPREHYGKRLPFDKSTPRPHDHPP